MSILKGKLILFFGAVVALGCGKELVYHASPHVYTKSNDTNDRPIQLAERKIFHPTGTSVYASNKFNASRLNDFVMVNDTLYRAVITPENMPINPSPWYAFKLWATSPQHLWLQLSYGNYRHRYRPKISHDGKSWELLDSTAIVRTDSTSAILSLEVRADTLWLAGQEVVDCRAVQQWCETLAAPRKDVSLGIAGKSKLGRDIPMMIIGEGSKKDKETVVIMSRQHPPEVTGYFAMQHFIERVLEKDSLATAFRKKFNMLVFPLMNPDGVDLGHWRHNAGGVDTNRDWAEYRQPEPRQVADFITNWSKTHDSQVILGLDFHSTYHDVYYTLDHERASSVLPNFTSQWFALLEKNIPGYHVREQASGLTRAVSKNWFNAEFSAEGITYEIGDQTPRDFIEKKGRVSAEAMMTLLLER